MKTSTVQSKLLYLAAAVAVGYLGTSAYFHFFPPALPEPNFQPPPHVRPSTPQDLLAIEGAGVDLPPEVRARMLGQPPTAPAAAVASSGDLHLPEEKPNYAFLIGEKLFDQVDDLKARLRTEEGSKQEDGVTEESLDAMAREGRMAW